MIPKEIIILPENVELEKVTIEVYKQKNLPTNAPIKYWLKEESARKELATHKLCEKCGNPVASRGYCKTCYERVSNVKYKKLPFEEWDGIVPLVIWNNDIYFFDQDDIEDYLEENDLQPEDLQLVICVPRYLSRIHEDYFEDVIPENYDSIKDGNKEVWQKIQELNEFIEKQPPFSWSQGGTRTEFKRTS